MSSSRRCCFRCSGSWGSIGSLRPGIGTKRDCITELDKVLPLLMDAEELRYYKRLHRLATTTSQIDLRLTE
ncbi:hypothetical protein ACFOZ0_01960 [Streptomyces yaanensis]|uniref:Uncharacterized protein n=1 Tax=Streptomyces yaanensis TaxID=1142239 RepID=A0ABV7S5A8_9ACTN|nr:hypothetical protein [Streptomyces sp. CGMCC 4.7035]WNB99658.1 hypothetical protein Q2K21_17175 [Streptomyces sp. CGMCC 4.7035]